MKQLGDPKSLKRDKHSKLNNATCLLANEKNIKHKHTKKTSCNGNIVYIAFVDVPETQNNNFWERSKSLSVWVGQK